MRISADRLKRTLDYFNRTAGTDYRLEYAPQGVRVVTAGNGRDITPTTSKGEQYRLIMAMTEGAQAVLDAQRNSQKDGQQ